MSDDTRFHCRVCGRPVPKGNGRGRKKEIHQTCTIVASRLSELSRLIQTMEFASQDDAKMLRGELFRLANGPGLQNGSVKLNPDSDEDI